MLDSKIEISLQCLNYFSLKTLSSDLALLQSSAQIEKGQVKTLTFSCIIVGTHDPRNYVRRPWLLDLIKPGYSCNFHVRFPLVGTGKHPNMNVETQIPLELDFPYIGYR